MSAGEVFVVGIDPSITATGIADQWGRTTYTIGYPNGEKGDERLSTIWEKVGYLFRGYEQSATHAVIEDLPINAHGAGITGMVQGVIRLQLVRGCIPYLLVPPAVLKKFATGKGTATKADMRMSLYQRVGMDIRDDNQVDAWWLREIGLHVLEQPTIDLPKTHLEALKKIGSWIQ